MSYDLRPMFGGHHGHIDLLLRLAATGAWPTHLACAELDDLARQALLLGIRARRLSRELRGPPDKLTSGDE